MIYGYNLDHGELGEHFFVLAMGFPRALLVIEISNF